MSSSFSRRVVCLSVALAAAVLMAPLAQANHGPRARATAPSSSASTWTASGREIDRLGPKYVPLQHPIATAPTNVTAPAPVVTVVRPVGFDWADAGIGAATTALALAVVATLALVITRRNRKAIEGAAPSLLGDRMG
jgi:hypothetical protein